MRLGGALILVAAVGAVVVGQLSAGSSPATLPRATSDRLDDFGGPQVHALYVVPSDGIERALDTDGTIAASAGNFQAWLKGQTGGRGLRLDTSDGELDVSFHRLAQTDAQLAARGINLRDAIEAELEAAGFAAAGKIYAVYYDGSNSGVCGGGAWPPSLPGTVAAVYMRATYGAGSLCYDPARSRTGLQIMDFAVLHEVIHTMGFIPTCAPHHTRAGHVSDHPSDLMYAGDAPWVPSVLDVGRDDYFGADVPGCPDLSSSPFLDGFVAPPPPQPPPPPSTSPPALRCVVPKVVGSPLRVARVRLRQAHCKLGRVSHVRSVRKVGLVVRQSPPARATRGVGTRVHVLVSRGSRR